ncbi:hypothetical protein [Atopomonas sediminilitoris]|uniref:hypothetical protein n=1 Tax=Atopomonas sediminilitoris TaxID=2919919 RepID=UPI001F4DD78D|nr:hypothetical protein [Atopomonas sediminilitoris]MCJ8170474.1 hypothetical protein [Atopomonas sediminilitoris]
MLYFKGEEVWGGLFGFGSLRKSVEWTGKDFDRHEGTRISTEAGVATYRRVYHRDREGRELNKISGKLSYSPPGRPYPSRYRHQGHRMALRDLIQQAHQKYGQAPSAVLAADQPTGEKPMELFITDEHTEYYMALQTGGDSDRGMLTGALGGVLGVGFAGLSIFLALNGKWEGVPIGFILAFFSFIVPFLWESRRPLPLPILFNRRNREVYFDHNGLLYHSPWDGIQAVACEFQIVGPYTAGMNNASLEILVRRLGEPDNALMVSLGAPMGKTLAMQKGFWEYIRAYMNNGPWFDKDGNHSTSDEFVTSQLAAHTKPTGFLAYTRQTIAEKKAAAGGKNYLSGIDAALFVGHLFFYPMDWIQEFTYNVAKRRSRNRWHQIVSERLQSDGPTTRLIDLERERGLDV